MTRPRLAAAPIIFILASACGPPPHPALPTGAGVPFPGFSSAYEQATADCKSVSTITAEIGLSGRAGGTKLRGRINAGLAAPDDIVLEGLAPFGKPAFVLSGRAGEATLWLPRDERVLRGSPPAAIVEALAGVALTPAELRAVVAGCGLGVTVPVSGRTFNEDSAAVEAPTGPVYLRRIEGRWRVVAGVRDTLTDSVRRLCRRSRHHCATCAPRLRISRMRLSQVDINTPIDPRAFDVEIPASAQPLSLEELRRAGPLGEKRE